jgi:carboxyl-terminal processing protease
MSRRLVRTLVLLYPKKWRERYEDELAALSEELLVEGQTTRLRLVVGICASASMERVRGARQAAHRRRPSLTRVAAGALAAAATAMVLVSTPAGGPVAPAGAASLCTGQSLPSTTSLSTVEQAYWCILDHYYSGPVLDRGALLVSAFSGFVDGLNGAGLDTGAAELPALRGDRAQDWGTFASAYQGAEARLGADGPLRLELARATLGAMVASLHDDHAGWQPPAGAEAPLPYGLGLLTSPEPYIAANAPSEAVTPLYITSVIGGPAAGQRLRPGDVIVSVNGAPPFVDGIVSEGVFDLLYQQYPQDQPVLLKLERPATGRTWTVRVKPTYFGPTALATDPVPTFNLLRGSIAYAQVSAFTPGMPLELFGDLELLGEKAKLRGLVLDLRGNGGGSPKGVADLLGAFVHHATWSYDCTVKGQCRPNQVDSSIALLHLPLVVLTDRGCVSACDAFSAAVRDLHLGELVGTRTGGLVSGPAEAFTLDDGSVLGLPLRHEFGPDHEMVDGVGVAPDYYLPRTAYDLSTGHDPDVAKALQLLRA